ncbi:hypothetical protein GQ44DRAFT_745818 [Phaeosphaeriaceae sp. PMI808]|nr:hypothetical protein GQ44DRAFT_745818 [Phaeosphaeriaceae sp. PMI808]
MSRHRGFNSSPQSLPPRRDSKGGIMGFFKRFTRKKSKSANVAQWSEGSSSTNYVYNGPDQTQRLPDNVLRRIFEEVCPHSNDETVEGSEDSGNDGCMSCDMRDLAHCALTRRQWYGIAAGLLYNSIRIDAVHYCQLEEVFAEQRRRSRHGDEIDRPTARLQQLCQSVRGNQYLGQRVRFIKLPYMLRESAKADLARTVSGCPNLEYIDLPDGFYTGDASCQLLRQELQARCPHIRKMKYNEGGEQTLESLMHGYWQELSVLELHKIYMEPSVFRQVLGTLPQLSELRISNIPWINDSTLHSTPGLPNFPPLETLKLDKAHGFTAEGLANYLSSPMCANRLRTLTIKDCSGLPVSSLHTLPLPPMTSYTLHKLNFEIISSSSNQRYPPGASYYQYLAKSLISPHPRTPHPPLLRRPTPSFNQPLEVYSKGLDELEWIFTSIIPPSDATGRRPSLSGGRPVSSYSAHRGLGPQWGGEARKSVVVPNGFGGFLAIPADDARPRSAGNPVASGGLGHGPRASWMSHVGREKRASRADLWR